MERNTLIYAFNEFKVKLYHRFNNCKINLFSMIKFQGLFVSNIFILISWASWILIHLSTFRYSCQQLCDV